MADQSTGTDILTIDEQFEREGSSKADRAKKVHGDFKKALGARVQKDRTFLEQYKIYRFHAKSRKFPWRSNVYVPKGHVNVVVKTARLLTAVMSSDPFFKPVAKSQQFSANEEALLDLMLSQQEDMEFPIVLHDWFLDMYIFSAGILKMYWAYDEEVEEVEETVEQPVIAIMPNGKQVPLQSEFIKRKRKEYTVTYDGPRAEVVNIFDFYVDPEATSIKKARYVIHRIPNATPDHLKSMVDRGVYDEDEVKRLIGENATSQSSGSSEKDELARIEGEIPEHDRGDDIELLEYVTKKRILTVGPNDTLLRDVPNPFKQINFFEIKHLRNAHKFFGIGTNEPSETIQEAINQTHNMRLDSWKITVQQMFIVGMGAILTPSDVVARPGGYVRVKPGYPLDQGIKELQTGSLPPEAYIEEDKLTQIDEVAVGVTEPDAGAGRKEGSRVTATAERKQSAGTSTRFGVELVLLEPALKDVLRFQHKLNQIFLNQPQEVRRKGEAGVTWQNTGPENIIGDFNFRFELSPVQGNRELWLQRILLIYKTLSENQQASMMTDWFELSKRLLKGGDIRNPEMILSQIPMIPLAQAQQMLMEQQMQMQGQQPGKQGQGGQGGGTVRNPAEGRMNAMTRTPQPTPGDMMRDQFAGVVNG